MFLSSLAASSCEVELPFLLSVGLAQSHGDLTGTLLKSKHNVNKVK